MNLAMNLPQAIRHARKELGLTQDAFARIAGIQRRQISILENGGNITLATLRRVLGHLPNLHRFTLETVAVEVDRTRSGD